VRQRDFLGLLASTATVPRLGRAQPPSPTVGFLAIAELGARDAGFRRGLSDAGYVEGRNLTIAYRVAAGHYERLPAMAAELVERKVALMRPADLRQRAPPKPLPRRLSSSWSAAIRSRRDWSRVLPGPEAI
jgi:putative ABC transport system substrate-binding protein